MKLSFVFLCLSLAALSLAAIPSATKGSSLSRRKHRKPKLASDKQVKKKPVKRGKPVPKKRLKKRVGATKGVEKTSAGAGEMSPAGSGSGKDSQGSVVLVFFPKVLVELIGGYLEGFSVVFERNWSAAHNEDSVAVDSERHYLITDQDVQASSHSGGEQVNLGSPDLSRYDDFHSSQDGRSLFFTGYTKEQVSSDSFEMTARWLVQETDTESLKDVTFESGESSLEGNYFMLSANGKMLLSTLFNSTLGTNITSVYQIEEHGKASLAFKKGDFDGYGAAVNGNGNRILLNCMEKKQLEIHDISKDGSQLVLKICYAGTTSVGLYCALNNDGSKAAFIVDNCRLYIVDVGKEKGSISLAQLTAIDFPSSVLFYRLRYDAKSRLYVFRKSNLWLVDPSERKLVSLEEAQVPQRYEIQSWDVSPNADYIALLIRSDDKNEKGEYQYQMAVKKDAKVPFMRLCGYES